ncbi:MAG: LytTR family DNA-binding domain-containing protein [Prevotellaceae bacterium]|jgi:two-component system LytT family response regulator|nr:LytTR family DNA-binding domain-containing protein [Prevotellaceae bacterium]
MKAIIIEDEIIAAEHLKSLIAEIEPDIEILAVLQSIEESVEWIELNPSPDLVFMDIHLADGSAFMIFDSVEIKCPIIFTTAYDEYALKAFEVNSIDYILKPIGKSSLEKAILKYKNFQGDSSQSQQLINNLLKTLQQSMKSYKSYFLVPEKAKLVPLATEDIYYIFIDTKIVKAITSDHKVYFMDKTLDEIMEQLDPKNFFRANRQYIISRLAVKDMSLWFGNKLSVNLKIPTSEKIIISKARVKEFKQWLSGSNLN